MSTEILEQVVAEVLAKLQGHRNPGSIPVGVSNRHIHLSAPHLERLFGTGYQLTVLKELSQPGQYGARETVTLVGPKGVIENVRVLGPVRKDTQVELAFTDARRLGVKVPVRDSGNTSNSPGVTVVGPQGSVTLEKGAIAAQRHIHMTPEDARELGVTDGQLVAVQVPGPRGTRFEQVLVRVSPSYRLELHLDTDEANGAGLDNGDRVELIGAEVGE